MKKSIALFISIFFSLTIFGQNKKIEQATGLPGDHFSLEGALEMFKNAKTPEDFEKNLNSKNNYVNNLDLNEDGEIDYIRVVGKSEGNIQLFILQAVVSESGNQDIAVIELEKNGDDSAQMQIIGDEEIFGEEIIIEASDIEINDGEAYDYDNAPPVNVYTYPVVRYVYRPNYSIWASPYGWRNYPSYWKPWKPLTWNHYHPLRARYYVPGYRAVTKHRILGGRNLYKTNRVSSVSVKSRNAGAHKNYKVTRSKTRVTGPRGNSVTKKTTKLKGRNGKKVQKTKVKRKKG